MKLTEEEKKQLQRERDKIRYENNKEKLKQQNKEYREKNKERLKIRKAQLYQENKAEHLLRHQKYVENNKEKVLKYNRDYYNNRSKTDVIFVLKDRIKSLIKNCFRKSIYNKKSKTQDILGCTFDEFKQHLESKFEPWMTWENRGDWNGLPSTDINQSWDIDHIIPLSTATCEEDIIRLNHYTNLQPLCSYTNRYIKRDNC